MAYDAYNSIMSYPPADIDQNTTANKPILSVSELNQRARSCLESQFSGVQVEGEISGLLKHRSGHWYFTLKDDEGELRAAMFSFKNKAVRFNPEDGQQVVLTGKLSLYAPRGSYQFIAERMAPAGAGQLQREFEVLKRELEKQGLFDSAHKKPLPELPKQVAIITSPQGAAIRDIQSTFARRFCGIQLIVIPVAVQGDGAAQAIADAIDTANLWSKDNQHIEEAELVKPLAKTQPPTKMSLSNIRPDAIIVGRGGGSIEDLWAFNEAVVAQAIYRSELPIISAVGHENDTTIADFVADMRAATPTAAAELLSPDRDSLLHRVQHLGARLNSHISYQINHAKLQLQSLAKRVKHPSYQLTQHAQRLDQLDSDMQRALNYRLQRSRELIQQLQQRLYLAAPDKLIKTRHQQTLQLQDRMLRSMRSQLNERQQHWRRIVETLNVVSPLATLKRGYAIVEDDDGNIIRSQQAVNVGDSVNARLGDGSIACTIQSKKA